MDIRLFKNDDLQEVADMIYESIHFVCQNDYTEEQLEGWAPKNVDLDRLHSSLQKNHVLVAEEDDKIVGIADIGETGYIDRLYVHKDYLNRGIASQLLERLEKYAKTKGLAFINIAASITSKEFLEHKGYEELQVISVERRGERLRRYIMEKKI